MLLDIFTCAFVVRTILPLFYCNLDLGWGWVWVLSKWTIIELCELLCSCMALVPSSNFYPSPIFSCDAIFYWSCFEYSLFYSSPDHCSQSQSWLWVVQYTIIIKKQIFCNHSKIYLFDQLIGVWWCNFLTKMLEVPGIWFSHFGHWIVCDLYFNITHYILKTRNLIANQRHQYIWLIH